MLEIKDLKKICLFCPVAIISEYTPSESEVFKHLKNSKKEILLAVRSLIDETIALLEKEKKESKPKKVKID